MRHPTCLEISRNILKTNVNIVAGKQGYGASMFTKAHCDIYWPKNKTFVLLTDDEISTSEVLEDLRDSLYTHLLIDLVCPWTPVMIKNFCKKIQKNSCIKTIIIVYTSNTENHFVLNDSIHLNTDENKNFQFLYKNISKFNYFDARNVCEFLEYSKLVENNLSKLMQKYQQGTSTQDNRPKTFLQIRDPYDFSVFIENNPEFQFDKYFSIEKCADIYDYRSEACIQTIDVFDFSETVDEPETLLHFPQKYFTQLMYYSVRC